MRRANAVRRRVVCAVLAFALLVAAPLCFGFGSMPASAETIPDSLRVYAQYWADPDSTVLLGEYSRAELDGLSYGPMGYEGYYCNVTNVCTVMRIHARGVILASFLRDYVGVDLNSVRQIDFHTTDVAAGARFVSKGRWELLDSPRYYYPHLMENSHIDYDLYERVVDDEEAALEGAVSVPTLLAVVQYATKNPNDNMSGAMTVNSTFRLCIGQVDLTTKTSFESAKWVDEIYVVFAGAPPEETTTEEATTEATTEAESTTVGSKTDKTTTESTTKAAAVTTTQAAVTTITTTTTTTKKTSEKTTGRAGKTQKVEEITTAPSGEADIGSSDVVSEVAGRQLIVKGYGSVVNWKENSDDITVLKKPTVTTNGARNALALFGVSFAAGAGIMFVWFKKEI